MNGRLWHWILVWQAIVNVPIVLVGLSFGLVTWVSLVLAVVGGGYVLCWRIRAAVPFFRALRLAYSRGIPLVALVRLFSHLPARVGSFTARVTLRGVLTIWDYKTASHHYRDWSVSSNDGHIRCNGSALPWPDVLVLYDAAPNSFYRWCGTVYL